MGMVRPKVRLAYQGRDGKSEETEQEKELLEPNDSDTEEHGEEQQDLSANADSPAEEEK